MSRGTRLKPAMLAKVLGTTYKVSFASPKDLARDTVGSCDHQSREIRVLSCMCPFDTADTIIHELMHAVLGEQGREYGGRTEEMYVRALATGMAGMMRDNPELFAALLAEVRRE